MASAMAINTESVANQRFMCLCGMGCRQPDHLANHIRSPKAWAIPGLDAWHRAKGRDVKSGQHGEWIIVSVADYSAIRSQLKAAVQAIQPAPEPVQQVDPAVLAGIGLNPPDTAPTAVAVAATPQPVVFTNNPSHSYAGIALPPNGGVCVAAVKGTGERCTATAFEHAWCGRHVQSAQKGTMQLHPSAVTTAPVIEVPAQAPTAPVVQQSPELAALQAELAKAQAELAAANKTVEHVVAAHQQSAVPEQPTADEAATPQINGLMNRVNPFK